MDTIPYSYCLLSYYTPTEEQLTTYTPIQTNWSTDIRDKGELTLTLSQFYSDIRLFAAW